MKTSLLATAIALMSISGMAAGDEVAQFLNLDSKSEIEKTYNVSIPKDALKSETVKVEEKYDSEGLFYSVEIQTLLFIPTGASAAVGKSFLDRKMEAEVFAGINAIRFLSTSKSVHIPYGARVRVALNENKSIYVEYQYQDIIDFGDKEGLLENPHTLSIIKMSKDRKEYYGCGIGQSIHHAWADESHAPEKSLSVNCRIGRRF